MADGDFCTVGNVKELLPVNKSITADDPFLQRLISAATKFTKNYIGDELTSQSYTEIRDGTGTGKIILSRQPVTAVASVSVGIPSARVPLVFETDYVWNRFGVQLLRGIFQPGVANVATIYTAGYVAIPEDIRAGVAKWVGLRYKESERLGQQSKTLANETITFDLSAIPRDVKLIFDQYKRVAQTGAFSVTVTS